MNTGGKTVTRWLIRLTLGLIWGFGLVHAETPWVVYEGSDGPGMGKHVVLVSGDEEYRSEEGLPQLGKILTKYHGFKCTVLFAINPEDGTIDPDNTQNIPGLQALRTADLMIIATRFRDLPDAQMKYVAEFIDAGKPVIGMRAAVVAFRLSSKTYERFSSTGGIWKGGFGQHILGQTWKSHHGAHGRESTRGVIVPSAKDHPIVRACDDIWGPTDVYSVAMPFSKENQVLAWGQVMEGMSPDDDPVEGTKNDPMMPMAWTRTYGGVQGQVGRVFMTTMGAATDLESEGLRRMLVNAAYWCLGLEGQIPARAQVDLVGEFHPLLFGFKKFKRDVRPSDHAMPPPTYQVLVADPKKGLAVKYNQAGERLWSVPSHHCLDAWPMEHGKVLMTFDASAKTAGQGGVRIVDAQENVLFEYMTPGEVMSCQPLDDGLILVSKNSQGEFDFVNRQGEVVNNFALKAKGMGHKTVRMARATDEGTFLAAECYSHVLREYDQAGKLARSFPAHGAFSGQRLKNGNTLIACFFKPRIFEVDQRGNVVWELKHNELPPDFRAPHFGEARGLPNGNTLVCNYWTEATPKSVHVFEITPDKRIIWALRDGRIGAITSAKPLFQNGSN
ncbi:MAG: ThuA domain-containing protein [Planctomycetes bacterium]|nr:ThuA domain-containing protein [Planctomycetota bacterium]